jgi:hypothetical protein
MFWPKDVSICCETSVDYKFHIDQKTMVEHFISERAHKLIVLNFLVKVWFLSHLCSSKW